MLIRVSARSEGIKEYLIKGTKQGRGEGREELDKRVVLSGDLELTDQIIKGAKTDGDRYLHITLSFKEDHVDEESLRVISKKFESYLFNAYRSDEYAYYAEAHLPRIKTYTNAQTGEVIDRKPHIHVVIPRVNLLTGGNLDPLGYVKRNIKFVDAFQEHVNQSMGFQSPKDNLRGNLFGPADVLSRHKGDVFEGLNRDFKYELLETVIEKRISSRSALYEHLSAIGNVRVRNAGTAREYLNITLPGAEKGINLKEHFFQDTFLSADRSDQLKVIGGKGGALGKFNGSATIESDMKYWVDYRSMEEKYLPSKGATRNGYLALSDADKKVWLAQSATDYYTKNGVKYNGGKNFNSQLNSPAAPNIKAARSINGVQNLSQIPVVRNTNRSEVLLQGYERLHVDGPGADSNRDVRRTNIGRGKPSTGFGSGIVTSSEYLAQQIREAKGDPDINNKIKLSLSGDALLHRLTASHGLDKTKYQVIKWSDGSDRIAIEGRNHTASDFLTKHMNLQWPVAREILLDEYVHQREARELSFEAERELWEEFATSEYYRPDLKKMSAAMRDELNQESSLWRAEYRKQRDAIKHNPSLVRSEKLERMSTLRTWKAEKDKSLFDRRLENKKRLTAEKEKKLDDRYRQFLLSKSNSDEAVIELRKLPNTIQPYSNSITNHTEGKSWNFIRPKNIDHEVGVGGEISYRKNDALVLRDTISSIDIIKTDQETLSLALRMAIHKFGQQLKINGDNNLKTRMAETAAKEGIRVKFLDSWMNDLVSKHYRENKKESLDKLNIKGPDQPRGRGK